MSRPMTIQSMTIQQMSTQEKIYSPPRWGILEARLNNLFSGRDLKFDIQVGPLPAVLTLGRGMGERLAPSQFALGMDPGAIQVCFDRTRQFHDLLKAADGNDLFGEMSLESLPTPVVMAVLEAFISPELGRAEALLGRGVTLEAPGELENTWGLGFELCYGEGKRVSGTLQIPLAHGMVELMEGLLVHSPRCGGMEGIGFVMGFWVGHFMICPREFEALGPGDVLIPDQWYPDGGKLRLSLPPHEIIGDLAPGGEGVILTALGGQTHNPVLEENMTEENNEIGVGSDPLVDPRELELKVVFELGELHLTLDEVSALAKGQVLSLPQGLEEGVGLDIRVNHQKIGRGRIVDLAGRVGIQIMETARENHPVLEQVMDRV